jgi:predicted metal-dependent phosphoesterase TrpH
MISARRVSLSVLAVGLVLGALADRLPDQPPARWEGRFVVATDLHVHSFLGDGAIAPWNLGREARRRGLDAIAITNHNQVFASRLGRWLSRWVGGAIILSGQEVTNPGYHIIAVGTRRAVDWDPPPLEIIEAIHAQGGLAIAAHPERAYWPAFAAQPLAVLDGAERLHPIIFHKPTGRAELAAFAGRAAAARPHPLAEIGSSDFHALALLGECRTFVFARALSEAGILEAIREGQTAVHAEGDPVPPYAAVPPVPSLGAGAILVWIGLLGMLLSPCSHGR